MFREDLYYRLNIISIKQIPLRERKDDIPLLADYFYKKFVKAQGKEYLPISDAYIAALLEYSFPGNIRELQNIIERSINLSESGGLETDSLTLESVSSQQMISPASHNSDSAFDSTDYSISEYEKKKIYHLIKKHNGNLSKTATELGIARSSLYRKMKQYGITKNIFYN